MGEALLRERAGDRFTAYSAGVDPKGVHPLTIEMLKEKGIDYVASQLVGAFAASALLWAMFTHSTLGATHPIGSAVQSFVLESVLTAILMFVILSVASGPKEKGLLAGVAIGGVIAFEALFAGPVSGASMNPARSLAPAVISGSIADVWIYLAAPMCGAAIGVLCHKLIGNENVN
jgi:aquaporin NIP